MQIDLRQQHQLIDADAFVDLVDAGIGRPAFNQLRADVGDKATVRGTARGRQFRLQPGDGFDGAAYRIDQIPDIFMSVIKRYLG